jgi:hypothetical protein
LEARICSGKVIWLKMMAGSGMASSRTSRAKRNSFRELATAKAKHQAGQQDHQRNPREEEFRSVDPQKQNDQPQGNHGNPAPGRSEFSCEKGFLFSQTR